MNNQNKVYDFNTELKKGKVGENTFLNTYNMWRSNTGNNVKDVDFIHTKYNETLELKTDFTLYNNVFFEEDSDILKGNKGGVVRAKNEGATYYVVYYIKKNEFHWFLVDELYERYNEIKKNYPLKFIKNTTYTGSGYAIPLNKLEDLEIEPIN
jgi:hypothetical protein